MADQDPIVFVVDDDGAARSSVENLLHSVGLRVEAFDSAAKFLERYQDRVLFGTDQGLAKPMYLAWWRLLETPDEYIPGPNSWRLYGLELPEQVLSKLYRDNAQRFAQLINDLPEVLEAYALTGEMDYHLKVATRGLSDLSRFVNDVLLPHDSVQHVKTSIVLDTLKNFGGLPLS